MELSFSLVFAAFIGFGHAFEADHLVAVSSIVTKRDNLTLAIKDGIFWGLGHSSTILLIGMLIIVSKVAIPEDYFRYLEAAVGLMLVLLGVYRLWQFLKHKRYHASLMDDTDNHHLAYGVGLVHGLAGSGALILLVTTQINNVFSGMLFLLLFGMGSVLGMLIAAGIFSLPFSKRIASSGSTQLILILISSLLCIGYGAWVLAENLNTLS